MANQVKVGDKLPLGTVAQVIPFKSKSNPANSYQTLVYTNGTISCSCPGWTRRVGPSGVRECKHSLLIEQMPDGGLAVATIGSGTSSKRQAPVCEIGSRRKFNFGD